MSYIIDNVFIDEVNRMASNGVSIAVDFDNTICLSNGYPNICGPNGKVFSIMQKWQDMGCQILLNTIRNGQDLDEAIVWCLNCGFTFNGINCNPEYDEKFPNHNHKLYATFFIDDKNVGIPLTTKNYLLNNDNIRAHVDWDIIDEYLTPVIQEINNKVKNHEK